MPPQSWIWAPASAPQKTAMPALSLAKTLPIKNRPDIENIPNRTKPAKKEKHGSVYLICNRKGDVLIRKRMEKGLLSGLYEFPWRDEGNYPELNNAVDTGREVIHVFTHFKLTLRIYRVQREQPFADGFSQHSPTSALIRFQL